MPSDVMPLTISDITSFAKALRADLLGHDAIPGHAAFLSAFAKAAGYDNHQHLRSATPAKPDPPVDQSEARL